jgi:hypothetical protein
MKNYFYMLLFFVSISFGQTEFTSIKLKNNPVTVNDTTQVDLLVREKAGTNKGMVRKLGWPYLATVISSMISKSSLLSITGYGIDNSDPNNPVVHTITELPSDFFISTSNSATGHGTSLTYFTDEYKRIDLQSFSETIITNTNEILRDGNNLFILANSINGTTSSTPILLIRLENCKIINNVLVPENVATASLTVTARTHGSILHRGFLYISTRPNTGSVGTQILKINPYDFSDVKSYQFDSSYNSSPNEIHGYKDWIYAFMCNYTTSPGLQRMVRISTDLKTIEEVFSYTNTANPNRRVGTVKLPFTIYNDEIYVVTTVTTSINLISVYVYDMKGNISRNVDNLNINPNNTPYAKYYVPHWMTIFNDKLIISPSDPSSSFQKLIRIDTKTLVLEEVANLPHTMTDDNSIFPNGYVYLNGESDPVTTSLIKVKYNNFLDMTTEINNYSSTGSINPFVETEGLKTKLSQFKNDLNFGAGTDQCIYSRS